MLRRRNKQRRKSAFEEEFENPYTSAYAAGGGPNSPAGSGNARPLVAPLRPASKIGEEDPNMQYAPYQPAAYYEDTSTAYSTQPSANQPYPPQQQQPQYYPMAAAYTDQPPVMEYHQHAAAPYGQQPYWHEQQMGSVDGSSSAGERHVPNLADEGDVPHSRQ